MSENSTGISLTVVDRTGDSSASDQELIIQKINHAIAVLFLLESRLALIKARLKQANESGRNNPTQTFAEGTKVSQTYKDQLFELWSAVENLQLKIENRKVSIFNMMVPEFLQSQNPGLCGSGDMDIFRNEIVEFGDKLGGFMVFQKELLFEKEHIECIHIQKQKEIEEIVSEIGEKFEQGDFQRHSREIQRNNIRNLKAKLGRNVINCLLTRSDINFEENPDLLDLKVKWRLPVTNLKQLEK